MSLSALPSPAPGRPARPRRPTATARFGSSRRESHDASAFYERFVAPDVSSDDAVTPQDPSKVDRIHCADAASMGALVDSGSVALVVTSPPYFAGKQYEESLGVGGVPGSYFEYLEMLRSVFSECRRVLEPGGRIAVNVANLGRRPYRSLAGDVTEILQDLGLLLRGEVVWWKGRAAGGSCAWGTFQRPANPVLRDVTERIVIASKGRFDRAVSPADRARRGLPSTTTVSREEFLEATTDLWDIPPESARRVGHPAPFPVEIPLRLIELYTYEGDLVLDPFMGSGSTAVAVLRSERHFVGFDTSAEYVATALARVEEERRAITAARNPPGAPLRVHLPASGRAPAGGGPVEQALREGRQAKEIAQALLDDCGFEAIRSDVRLAEAGVELTLVAEDRRGGRWAFDVSGAFTTGPAGLRRSDVLWKALGKAAVVHAADPDLRLVLLTTDAPSASSAGSAALARLSGPSAAVFDVVELTDPVGRQRLRAYASGMTRRTVGPEPRAKRTTPPKTSVPARRARTSRV